MSTTFNLRRVLAFTTLTALVTAQAPAGYTEGFSTQDNEPAGQQGPCTTGGNVCHAPTPLFPSNAGPAPLPAGVFAAAINPALIGAGSNNCQQCGMCYSIINAGMASPKGPGGPTTQGGVKEIKVVVVNQCMDCSTVQFDINAAPAGWDNPKIWFKQLDSSACGVSASPDEGAEGKGDGSAEEGGDPAAAGGDKGKNAVPTGGDPKADAGDDPKANASGNPKASAGSDLNTNTGGDSNTNAGGDANSNAGGDSDANSGSGSNANAGADPKPNTGSGSNTNGGSNSNANGGSDRNTNAGGDSKSSSGGDSRAGSGEDSAPLTVQKSKANSNTQPGKNPINNAPGGDPATTVPGTGKQPGVDKSPNPTTGQPKKQAQPQPGATDPNTSGATPEDKSKQGSAVGGSTTNPQKQKQKAGTGMPSQLSVAPIEGGLDKNAMPADTDGEDDECVNEDEDEGGEAAAPAPVDPAKEAPKGRRQLIPRPRSLERV